MVLSEHGIDEKVVTYPASGFARTLNAKSNQGNDRAWGGNPMVMGRPAKRWQNIRPISSLPDARQSA